MKEIYWVEDGRIAGRSYPSLKQLERLYVEGFRVLVPLEKREDIPDIERIGFKVYPIPVEDFASPSIHQLEEFNSIIREAAGVPVLVHCTAGCGRTGTVLASYLIKKKSMTAKQAKEFVRSRRPGAVETQEQEDILEKYEEYVRGGRDEW